MTVLKWIVQCDGCKRKMNAIDEEFLQSDHGDFCRDCDEGTDPDHRYHQPPFRIRVKHVIIMAALSFAFILCCSVMGYLISKLPF